jgi:hypothetical protein
MPIKEATDDVISKLINRFPVSLTSEESEAVAISFENGSAGMLRISPISNTSATSTQPAEAEEVVDLLAAENIVIEQGKDLDIGPIVRMKQQYAEQPPINLLISEPESVKRYWTQWDRLMVRGGDLYRLYSGRHGLPDNLQVVLPASLKEAAFRRSHICMVGGHLGLRKTMDHVIRRFYWLTWRSDVARYHRRCVACCSYHCGRLARTALLQPIETGAPFQPLSIDPIMMTMLSSCQRSFVMRIKSYEST